MTVNEHDFDYELWQLVRYTADTLPAEGSTVSTKYAIPSYSSINSLLSKVKVELTSIGFAPILPYPATDFDAIHTTMINFQDVLEQKDLPYGALWCDEGVYRIAKELQFLFSEKFKNIFIGLGGFHTEKVILACCGIYLKDIGARDIFVTNEIYRPLVTENAILTGKDYVQSREAMRNLAESVNRIRIEKFKSTQLELLKPFDQLVADICSVLNEDRSEDRFLNAWTNLRSFVDKIKFRETFRLFNETGATQSELWSYWNIFLDAIMPVVIDLTRSFRDANWKLHLSAIRRAMPLLFAFGRTNYCRWMLIYYEDCLSLKSNFPLLWESFKKGDFVVHHTRRQGSGVPIDQALEKEYNKPAKGAGGIIGFTRKKESVAKWNIMKHEKEKFTKFIDDVCEGEDVGEYSLHHEFSRLRTAKDEEDIKLMKDFIVGRCDITKPGKLINMVTGSVLSDDNKISLLTCIEKGEDLYQEYRNTRLIQKKTKLFDILSLKHSIARKRDPDLGMLILLNFSLNS